MLTRGDYKLSIGYHKNQTLSELIGIINKILKLVSDIMN